MDCSVPGFPVLHYLPEFAQTQVHWVNVAIQPSHPLLPSSPHAFSLSQHQGTLSLLQHHSLKASVLRRSAFFMDQLLNPCMTTGKTIALTMWIFVSIVMSLLCNTLSKFVIDFLPRSKQLWISWLRSPSTLILEPKKIKSVRASPFSPSLCHEVMGSDAMILVFWMLSFRPAF